VVRMFCPKCGTLLSVRREQGKVVKRCPNCGYTEEVKSPSAIARVTRKRTEKKPGVVAVSHIEEGLPVTDEECPKCGNVGAYWWIEQTRSGDEPPTRFYRCVKCKHTWREYA